MNKFKYKKKFTTNKLLIKKHIKIQEEKLFEIKNKKLEINILTKIEKRLIKTP